MALQPGHTVDRYQIQTQIGEGGMAMVYLVRHSTLDTQHALKVLSVANTNIRNRLVQEGRAQAQIQHKNVVSVTDVLEINGSPALLMEYIEGPALDDWLVMYRPTLDEALALFRGIVGGVMHAHEMGLIHRDLKPANVMLAPTEKGIVPKVTDFGLAKAMHSDEPGRAKTRTGATMGTPAYMAPEQIRDASTVDERADVYALGCMLYELVCGRTPFEESDIIELFKNIGLGKYQPAQEISPNLPIPVIKAIDGALQTQRDNRISSCEELLATLDGDHHSVPARRAGSIPDFLPVDSNAANQALAMAKAQLERRKTDPPKVHTPTWTDSLVMDDVVKNHRAKVATPKIKNATSVSTSFSDPQHRRVPWVPILGLSALAAAGLAVAGVIGAVVFLPELNPFAPQTTEELPVHGGDPVLEQPEHSVSDLLKSDPSIKVETTETPVEGTEVTTPDQPPVKATPKHTTRKAKHTSGQTSSKPKNTTEPKVTTDSVVSEEPPPPAGSKIVLKGDAKRVYLKGKSKTFYTHEVVPAGTYTIQAMFPGSTDIIPAGKLSIFDGQESVTILCNSAAGLCKKK